MMRGLPEYQLVLAGNNTSEYAKSLVDLAKQLNISDRVIQTGKIDDLAKQYYLSNCSAFVFPSLREGFGIPPIEAMRFGKPVFLSNNTSLPEIGGEHAFYWNNYDTDHMIDVFTEGMKAYQENEETFKQAYISRAKSFDWNATARQYLDVYKSLLS